MGGPWNISLVKIKKIVQSTMLKKIYIYILQIVLIKRFQITLGIQITKQLKPIILSVNILYLSISYFIHGRYHSRDNTILT